MRKIAVIAALSASAFGLSAGASFADYTLTILHINDWHSRIESNNAYESTCSAEEETEGKCIGGAARLVTAIADRRKANEGKNVLLLNGGDNFQGSLFYTTYKGKAEAEFLNLMKFDAMTVGNHEFDDGEDALVPFLEEVTFPVLSANVHPNAQSKVGDRIKPSLVLDVGGQKIGIIGAVTTDTPEIASPGPNIAIEDDIKTITAEVEKLKGEGVNKIIALTHVGYPRDKELIARIPGVDVVVGGHSHSLLSNTDDKAEGPYPTMIDNPDGYRVPVTQAASYSKYLGEFTVTFDDNGVVKEAKGDPIFLDKSITPDAAVLVRVKELAGPIEEVKAKEVSETTAPIDGDRKSCRARECEMGNLVSEAILDRVKDQGVTIVFQNGGGLRASIDQGVVTMGEVLNVLPFQNTLATFQLTGKDVVASLEHGVSMVEEEKGAFPQVAGLKYSFDKSVGPNAGRIKSVEVMENGAWAPIDEAKLYTVATNNFTRGGGDGYELFEKNAENAYDFGPSLEQVVADYLTANRPYTPKLDGRIVDLAAAAPETAAAPAQSEAAAAPAAAEPQVPAPPAASADIAATPPTVETAAAPAATEAAAPAAAENTHTIVRGDTLWHIARKAYGAGSKWKVISDANPGIDALDLTIGSTLKIPPAS
ncbi:5'-nucleotidase C-terminal domain-containing protein [Mesorhizobium sp. YM1C-6-2]|uniref:5'-nucleotidase C-terminal domain-containing protein n=1 Tax=Mesorhizobium sp. YM1C-6-2 TaxID=1827501 RepID=UPI000EF1BA54|nr:5'-nucleotidase C-terminal domain-containing protein [Mesorhizobium sp. YM1C-6-2]RLP26886.1 LysM peptidoglycan-binding domain-containing protein [Mesorhizobium sp. YM1C-6-2]